MALIKCPNCQKDVSSMVTYCPFCSADLTHIKASIDENIDYYNPDSGYPPVYSENRSAYTEQENQTASPDYSGHRSSSERQSTSYPAKPVSDTTFPPRKGKRQAPYGRRLLGYRAYNPLYMLISICYHMAACVGILYAFRLSPQYLADGTLIFHLCRVILAAIMLFLPVLLLSENKIRRKLPLLGSRKNSSVAAGFILLYIPLAALFCFSWYFCL